MTLEEYLNDGLGGFPQPGIKGIPSEWMHVASLTVSHGSLWAGDPYICDGEDGCTIAVPNGEYVVEAQGWDFDGIRVIGRTRARSSCTSQWSLGNIAGETGTDSAMMAICDIGSVEAAVGNNHDGFQNAINNYTFQRFGLIQIQLNGVVNIAYVNSGFGDGTGPMYKLMEGDNCVGIELDFIGVVNN